MTLDEPTVYVVDDDLALREAIESLIESVGFRVETFETAEAFLGSDRSRAPACVVLDVRLPGLNGLDLQRELARRSASIPIVFITGHGNVSMSVQAMRAGAVHFITKPFPEQVLLDAIDEAIARDRTDRCRQGESETLRKHCESLAPHERDFLRRFATDLHDENPTAVSNWGDAITAMDQLEQTDVSPKRGEMVGHRVRREDAQHDDRDGLGIVGQSKALADVMAFVEQVGPTNACVLVQGETGTGKELIARAVHRASVRKHGTFIKLNCAAIPAGLWEAELFGHEKGAFTGAVAQCKGRFEVADAGTIFLDEVGEIPLELQAKLLRVLEDQELERIGSTRTIRVDVRLIAASNRNLAQMMEDRQFRDDLYYRLNVFPIAVPSLRQRTGDIPLLVQHFVGHYSRLLNKKITHITPETMKAFERYSWPGNVREIKNFIERSVILSSGSTLAAPLGELRRTNRHMSEALTLEDAERQHILRILDESNWVVAGPSGAAVKLGMKRTSLQYKIQKLEIHRPQCRPI